MGIQNPLDTAQRVHSFLNDTFDIDEHNKTARLASQGAHKSRVDDELLSLTPQTPSTTEERGDVGCFGCWRSGCETIFNIRVNDTIYQLKSPRSLNVRKRRRRVSIWPAA